MSKLTTEQKYTNSLRALQLAQWRYQAMRSAWETGLPFEHVLEEQPEGNPENRMKIYYATGFAKHYKAFQVMAASTLAQCVNDFCASFKTQNRNTKHMGLCVKDYPEREQESIRSLKKVRDKLTAHTDDLWDSKLSDAENLLFRLWGAFVQPDSKENPHHQGLSLGSGQIENIGKLIDDGLEICREKEAKPVEGHLRMFIPDTLTGCFGVLPGEADRGERRNNKIRYYGKGMKLVGEVGPHAGEEDWELESVPADL